MPEPLPSRCAVVELRQYTLHPGRRDALIALFDREFVETQEAVGMTVIGQFRDLDHPDRFVWLRGFPDMTARARSLAAFYGGPVWAAHGAAANATMIDSDDVLLLRPAGPGRGFGRPAGDRPPPGADVPPAGLVVAGICHPGDPTAASDCLDLFDRTLAPALAAGGARLLATLVTEDSRNTFPRLPVREGETVLVWLAGFDDPAAHQALDAALRHRWPGGVPDALARRLVRPVQFLRLAPTARSLLRG